MAALEDWSRRSPESTSLFVVLEISPLNDISTDINLSGMDHRDCKRWDGSQQQPFTFDEEDLEELETDVGRTQRKSSPKDKRLLDAVLRRGGMS